MNKILRRYVDGESCFNEIVAEMQRSPAVASKWSPASLWFTPEGIMKQLGDGLGTALPNTLVFSCISYTAPSTGHVSSVVKKWNFIKI